MTLAVLSKVHCKWVSYHATSWEENTLSSIGDLSGDRFGLAITKYLTGGRSDDSRENKNLQAIEKTNEAAKPRTMSILYEFRFVVDVYSLGQSEQFAGRRCKDISFQSLSSHS